VPYREASAAGERGEGNAADRSGEQEFERIDGIFHDGTLMDAVAQPVEGFPTRPGKASGA